MTKILETEINRCFDCPNQKQIMYQEYCYITGTNLREKNIWEMNCFPDDCPLPDKEETKPLELMKWLDELIESMALDEEASVMAPHEHHEYLGIIRGLQIVKDKALELGLADKEE